MDLRLKIFTRMEDIPREEWNHLAPESSPILDWEYLCSLEKSGSVSSERGYKPWHLGFYSGEKLVAAVPLYLRDRAWVEFGDGGLIEFLSELTGLPFHSGLVGNIPYTPIPGYDFLVSPLADRSQVYRHILGKIDELCLERGLSTSRIYFVAQDSDLHSILAEAGYMRLSSAYLVWRNRDYNGFEDYLATFRSSRRKKIKHEWRSVHDQGIQLEMVPGTSAPHVFFNDMFLLYRHTWTKYMGTGIRPFLNESFFNMLAGTFRGRCSFAVATSGGKRIAMSLFYNKADKLYGRYWGCFREVPFLHFATCYYFPISYGIENGIRMIDPGFGGEHKLIRGFETTQVSHYIKFYDVQQRRIAHAVLDQMRNQLQPK